MKSKQNPPFGIHNFQKKKLSILSHYYKMTPEQIQQWAIDVLWNERINKDLALELFLELDWLQESSKT